jgi:protein arginine kinase activator
MKCDACGEKEATVFLTQIVEGTMHKVNLCESCAKEKGVNDPTGFALTDVLLGLGSEKDIEAHGGPKAKCPTCGLTLADFKKTGRLGCSACYDAFGQHLEGMLKNMHKGLVHKGKIPHGLLAARNLDDRIRALRDSLAEAVASEEYERAADIRDQIRKIEGVPEQQNLL